MIKVKIKKKDKDIIGFEVSGHAEYDDSGKDIVCAGVSMLVFNTIDTLTDILKLEDYIDYELSEDRISLDLIEVLNQRQLEDFQLIMRKLELGIISTIQSYREYIELDYLEV